MCVVQSGAWQPDSTLLKKHIRYLASNALKGRAPGTPGERKAATYIADYFASLGLTPKGTDGYFQHFTYTLRSNPHDTSAAGPTCHARNVIAFLDNKAPKTIVIGAHYDHLGKDGRGASMEKKPKGKIHNGADDNASGTAGVLELARYYTQNDLTEPVNFLFMCFSAEEAGLIGSKHFVRNPTISISTLHAMINMDMIGRLSDTSQKLMIYGVGTGDIFVETLKRINAGRFTLVMDSSGIGPSDQTSFYLAKVPVLHFFTGQHTDYHRASDDARKINYAGECKVLSYIADVINEIANRPVRFAETAAPAGNKVSFKVTLGIMPDYAHQGKGIKIDAVHKDRPAHTAGIQAGDLILRLGDYDTLTMQDYMAALAKFNKGDTTTATIQRGNKTLTLTIKF